jgi:nicotinamidase-related amidase
MGGNRTVPSGFVPSVVSTYPAVATMGAMTSNALIVIDVQEEYFSGKLPIVSSDRMESLQRIGDAMDAASAAGAPVIVVRHSSNPGDGVFDPDLPTWALRPEVADRPRDLLIDKRLPGSFTGTNLEAALRDAGVDGVTIAGYMTNVCCDTTARQALHLGFAAEMLADAVGTPDMPGPSGGVVAAADLHTAALATLGFIGVGIVTTESWASSLSDG